MNENKIVWEFVENHYRYYQICPDKINQVDKSYSSFGTTVRIYLEGAKEPVTLWDDLARKFLKKWEEYRTVEVIT